MTTKEYLSQAIWLDRSIDTRLEEATRLRELACRTANVFSGEKLDGTAPQSKLENAIARLVDLEREITADIDRLVDLKREIGAVIGQVARDDYRQLLFMRYLQGKTWPEIAAKMFFTVRWATTLHLNALGAVKTSF